MVTAPPVGQRPQYTNAKVCLSSRRCSEKNETPLLPLFARLHLNVKLMSLNRTSHLSPASSASHWCRLVQSYSNHLKTDFETFCRAQTSQRPCSSAASQSCSVLAWVIKKKKRQRRGETWNPRPDKQVVTVGLAALGYHSPRLKKRALFTRLPP